MIRKAFTLLSLLLACQQALAQVQDMQAWCASVEGNAYNIMSDLQNGVSPQQVLNAYVGDQHHPFNKQVTEIIVRWAIERQRTLNPQQFYQFVAIACPDLFMMRRRLGL